MILFDDIIFACRSFCTENLRNASFVRFLDEEGLAPNLSDIDYDKLQTGAKTLEKLSKQAVQVKPEKEFVDLGSIVKQSVVYVGVV